MGKLFIFMGKSASGKDTLYQKIMDAHSELKKVVSYTTRPIRSGEEEGNEYHFVTKEQLQKMEKDGKVIELRCYETIKGPWYYFTADDGQIDFADGDYCLISTLEGYEKIRNYFGEEKVVPVYIEVEDFLRISRSLEREQAQKAPCVAEVCRRFLADEADFSEEKLREAGIFTRVQNNDLADAICQIEAILKNGR